MKFVLKKIMQYTEELEVEADSKQEAGKMAETRADEFERVNDDHYYDLEIITVSKT